VTSVSIEEVLAGQVDEWMALPGVVGVGIGEAEGEPCLTVLVAQMTAALREKIPAEVGGYRVVVTVTGSFSAH